MQVAQYPLDCRQVRVSRSMHVKAHLLDCIRDIRPSKGEILQGSDKTPVLGGIANRIALKSWYVGLGVHRCAAWFALSHTCVL
jgi:hypothetical protein